MTMSENQTVDHLMVEYCLKLIVRKDLRTFLKLFGKGSDSGIGNFITNVNELLCARVETRLLGVRVSVSVSVC